MDLWDAVDCQGEVTVGVREVRVDAGDPGCEPLTMLERDELIIGTVPQLNGGLDVGDVEAPRR